MLILSVDSTATPASVCLYEDRILADYFINTKLTHSQTLVSMIDSVFKVTGRSMDEVDLFAVNNGPGSFTGVRIGVSAVKGMAYAEDKPCVAVSTLESMAYNTLDFDGIVCACMDARRNQVYNALFRVKNGTVERICDDRAISVDDLLSELEGIDERICLLGDGAKLVFDAAKKVERIFLASENIRYQNASSTALIASLKYQKGEILNSAQITPSYLRLSQAERERQNQKG